MRASAMRTLTSILIAVILIAVVVGGVLAYRRDGFASLRDVFRSVKETSQDAATTSKVKTALLLSKQVSAFDVNVNSSRGEVTLAGEVPNEETKRLAVAIAQDTSGVGQVHDGLTINSAAGRNAAGRNQDRENLANPQAGPEPVEDKLAKRVEFELYSTRAVPLDHMQVRSQDGTVILSGGVGSRAEKLLAERVAQSVEGVKRVVNDLNAPETATR